MVHTYDSYEKSDQLQQNIQLYLLYVTVFQPSGA